MHDISWQKIVLWASFIIFLGSLLLRQESAITQDLGRHLRLGEMIVAGGPQKNCARYSNCLTYTYPDYPFVNHHWSSEVIFYLVHKIGGFPGIIIFKAIILGLAFFVTLLHSLELNKGPAFLKRPGLLRLAIAITLVFLSIQMMADRLTTRPEIFGYSLFAVLFWMLSSKFFAKRHSWLVFFCFLLIVFWTNLHISFVFGLLLIYLWTAISLIAQKQHISVISLPVAATLATLLNPAGLRGALMPLSILKNYGYTIVENMTPFFLSAFKPQPEYWIYALLLLLTTFLLIVSPKKPPLFSISTLYLFSIFPLIAVRHLPFFSLTTVPVLTPLIIVKFRKLHNNEKFTKLPILIAGGLLIAALTNPIPLTYSKLPPINLNIDSRHDLAIEFVKQSNLQGPMWNNYDIGSFLEWAIPQHPTFVDGRPEAFPVGFFRETYIPMQESRQKWDEVVRENDIQWVFAALTDATPWFQKWWQMVQKHPDWKTVYLDKTTAILVSRDGPNAGLKPQGKAKTLELLTF